MAARALAPLLLAWMWLHAPAWRWLGRATLGHPGHALSLALVAALAAALLPPIQSLRLAPGPTRAPGPLLLLLGGTAAAVLCERLLQIHTLSALFMGLSGYGLLGLMLRPGAFRRGLPAALALCSLVPLGVHGSALLGMSARVLCAQAVQKLLAGMGVAATSAETILVLESGVAHLDAPCSGLRSLWSGLLLFLAASWLGGHRSGLRWLACGIGWVLLLLWANIVRVLVLVLCALWLRRPGLAEAIHLPLGVLGFVGACGTGLLLLRTVPRGAPAETPPHGPLSRRSLAALVAALLALGLLRPLLPSPLAPPPAAPIRLPDALSATPLALTPTEAALFSRLGARADKHRVALGDLRGSLLLVMSEEPRAHHPPELCLASAGLHIDAVSTAAGPGFPLRRLRLRHDERPLTAVYWYQSRRRTTANFLARLGASLAGDRAFVLVSLLLDDERSAEDSALGALLQHIHGAVARSLQGASP